MRDNKKTSFKVIEGRGDEVGTLWNTRAFILQMLA
jgi:hypothetical protein